MTGYNDYRSDHQRPQGDYPPPGGAGLAKGYYSQASEDYQQNRPPPYGHNEGYRPQQDRFDDRRDDRRDDHRDDRRDDYRDNRRDDYRDNRRDDYQENRHDDRRDDRRDDRYGDRRDDRYGSHDGPGGPGGPGGGDGERGMMGALAGGAAGAFGGAKFGGQATGHSKTSGLVGALVGAFAGSKLEDAGKDWKDGHDKKKDEEKKHKDEEKLRRDEEKLRRDDEKHDHRRRSRSSSRSSHHRRHDSGERKRDAPRSAHYGGGFTTSSRDVRLDESHGEWNLRASCKRYDGSYESSTLSLNKILENDCGSFRWYEGHHSGGGGGPRSYTVQQGDTLRAIAAKFGGTSFEEIARHNGISNPDLIYPGQTLQIPGGGGEHHGGGGHGGNFGSSARHVRLVDGGQKLEAELRRENGDWVHASIVLDERIKNDNGTLQLI